MAITVAGRKMTVTDATRQYAEEKIGNAMKVMDIDPLDAEVVLSVKKNPSIALPCVCEVTIRTKGNVVRVEEEEQDMFSAIDVAAAKVLRQLRKYKTRVIDRKVRAGAHGDPASIRTMEGEELDLDALMADLSADEEIVRVKEIEFAPMTEEEALLRLHRPRHRSSLRALSSRRRRLRRLEAEALRLLALRGARTVRPFSLTTENRKRGNMTTIDTIKDILHENLDIDPADITEESTFESLNIDSLDMVELVCELEDRLDIDLGEFDDSEGIKTLGQFVEYVEGL